MACQSDVACRHSYLISQLPEPAASRDIPEDEEVQAPVANENPDETSGAVDFYVHNGHNDVACA
jgi:hypothetical protein